MTSQFFHFLQPPYNRALAENTSLMYSYCCSNPVALLNAVKN